MPRAVPLWSPWGKRVWRARMARVEGQSAKGREASSATKAVWALCPSSGVEPWAFCPAQATWRASPSWVQVQVTAPSKARA